MNGYSKTFQYRRAWEQVTLLMLPDKLLKKAELRPSSNPSKKKKEEGTLPDSVYKASTTLTLKPNKIKKTKQNHKKTQLQVSIPNEHRCENPQQNASKQFPNTRKGPDSTECELSNVTNHIN